MLERWVTRKAAADVYGVIFVGREEDETLAVDLKATAARRSELRQSGSRAAESGSALAGVESAAVSQS